MAYMMGKQILKHFDIPLEKLTHINFEEVREYLGQKKEHMSEEPAAMRDTLCAGTRLK